MVYFKEYDSFTQRPEPFPVFKNAKPYTNADK